MILTLMKSIRFLAVSAILTLAGCATRGAAYAKAHPEISPTHRQILITGKIPGGTAAAGMTKEQVRLAVGSPKRIKQASTGEAWVYVHQRFLDVSPRDETDAAFGAGPDRQRNFTETAHLGPRPSVTEKATVFFRGDRATHVVIGRE